MLYVVIIGDIIVHNLVRFVCSNNLYIPMSLSSSSVACASNYIAGSSSLFKVSIVEYINDVI